MLLLPADLSSCIFTYNLPTRQVTTEGNWNSKGKFFPLCSIVYCDRFLFRFEMEMQMRKSEIDCSFSFVVFHKFFPRSCSPFYFIMSTVPPTPWSTNVFREKCFIGCSCINRLTKRSVQYLFSRPAHLHLLHDSSRRDTYRQGTGRDSVVG